MLAGEAFRLLNLFVAVELGRMAGSSRGGEFANRFNTNRLPSKFEIMQKFRMVATVQSHAINFRVGVGGIIGQILSQAVYLWPS